MNSELIDRLMRALYDLVDKGLEDRFSPADVADLRRLHLFDAKERRAEGKSSLARAIKTCISDAQDATRDGDGYPETKEILDRWNINLDDLKIDAQDVLAKTLERGRITSHLNYYVCRTQFERTSTVDPKTRNQLDHILEKFEQKWGA